MSVKVKICGLRTQESLDAALEAGADYFGARALAAQGRGRAKSVALLVNPDDEAVKRVADEVAPDLIQLHGRETPERVREVKDLTGREIIKAIMVESAADAAAARDYDGAADLILYDAKEPEDAIGALPGGNGVPFDWRALMSVKGQGSFMLSGGLTSDNVADAIAATGAAIVDVSSGVESAPGEKDAELIARFICAAKSQDKFKS
ncbi:MAG: phosphoribosylanthranilate isomerase [Methyloligellaceae bacterium]